ncbi:Lrp/AsnC family transcriptional regulator [uncultured Ferrimonas sp.]|uniref:Lrp/AsnC family transcriptional regulator n=1 Tax=uncultured Ferrimonas sp. TaxID=432640 RepID=UPI0026087550|nr:Lrp/AsnC family transcriptional regulator [uncultured Ferrimonas sp.]
MDQYDQGIIAALRLDARQSTSALARQVNLSRSAVADRLKKLEQSGVIQGYRVSVRASAASDVSAYFEIEHNQKSCQLMAQKLRLYPELQSCHGISGQIDLLLLVRAPSMQRLHSIREQIESWDEVTKITTHVVMNEWF